MKIEFVQKKLATMIIAVFAGFTSFSQNVTFAPYPPPSEAEVFAEGIVSNRYAQRDITISPDQTILIYTQAIDFPNRSDLVARTIENGEWSLPFVLPFSGISNDLEPSFSPDGSKLYFASNRASDIEGTGGFDIWVVDRNEDGSWGTPENVGLPVNSVGNEFFPSIDENNQLYFTGVRSGGVGGEDIWVSQLTDGIYSEPQLPDGGINTSEDDFNAFVTPDGNTMFLSDFRQEAGSGGGDLYVSVKTDGVWSGRSNMGEDVNTSALDYCPYLTPDRNYFFFTSRVSVEPSVEVSDAFDVINVIKLLATPSGDNIYWMKYKE